MRQMVCVALVSLTLAGCESVRVLSDSSARKVGDFAVVSSPLYFQHHVVNTKKETTRYASPRPVRPSWVQKMQLGPLLPVIVRACQTV